MKAALLSAWNSLSLTELDKPVPTGKQALIKVRYGGVCGSDITVYRGLHMTATVPRVLCHEILGTIETLPEGYDGPFKAGERVLMNPVISCGKCPACRADRLNVCEKLELLGIHQNGGFEEYTVVNTEKLVHVPDELPDIVAVLGEPFAVGRHVCRRAGVSPETRVLVIGAGTIGQVVAMNAKCLGARSVTVSEINPGRLALAAKLELETIDPNAEDIRARTAEITEGVGFDIVIDAAGAKASLLQLPDLCRVGGTILSLGLSGAAVEFILGKISFREQEIIGSRLYSQKDFEDGVAVLSELARKLPIREMVSDIYPLTQITEAFEKMMTGRNNGKIVIDVAK